MGLLKPNKLKEILAEGKVAYGTCMTALSPSLVELAGFAGYTWCRIDTEHNWRREIVEQMVRAAVVGDIVPIVRIDKDDPYAIRKVLEIGAAGFIVPAINTAEEVQEIIRAAKFPPKGDRGFSGLCSSAKYGLVPADEWVKWSNEETMVGVMIETKKAVENIEEIMSVEGLDFVLFGPADYSVAIGLGKPAKNDPLVQEAIKKTIAAGNKHHVSVMLGIAPPWNVEAKKYTEMGIKLIEVGHDYSILSRAWKEALQESKE
jgi:4-hydroxy-2-oxoheptanedioate aldolase